ncbi:MAG: tetratricopeptide repeat protein [Anaerolineae bacterium]|nr:tetratricopeptide repeat protein [Anaerolineae bacterium]
MSDKKLLTWHKLLQQRGNAHFVDREYEYERFRLNFVYQVPQNVVFGLYGPDGIGKSTLMRRFCTIAKEHGALTTWVNFEQATAIQEQTLLQIMVHISRQMTKAGTPLTEFDTYYAQYAACMQAITKDPDTPSGVFDMLEGNNHSEESQSKAWTAYLVKKFSDPDKVALIKRPVKTLSHFFVKELNSWSTQRLILLCFDDWEYIGLHLNDWLRQILLQGELTTNLWIAIAAQEALDISWLPLRPLIAAFELTPFSERVTQEYLKIKGITDKARNQDVWSFSKGLPALVAMLASATNGDAGDLALGAVDRYLKWLENDQQRKTVLHSAAARRVNLSVITALFNGKESRERFDWLIKTPLVDEYTGYWCYHPEIRNQIINFAHERRREELEVAHTKLRAYYQHQLKKINTETPYRDPVWRQLKLEALYHGLMLKDAKVEYDGIESFLLALHQYYPLAGEITRVWQQAAREQSEPKTVAEWATVLTKAWEAIESQDWQSLLECCERITQREDLSHEAWGEIQTIRTIAELQLGVSEITEPVQPFPQELEAHVIPAEAEEKVSPSDPTQPIIPSIQEQPAQDQREEPVGVQEPLTQEAGDTEEKIPTDLATEGEQAVAPRGMLTTEMQMMAATQPITAARRQPTAEGQPDTPQPTIQTPAPGTQETGIPSLDLYEDWDEVEKALDQYTRDMAPNPAYAVAYNNRANAYFDMGEYAKALEEYSKAIERNPQYTVAYNNRGLTYAQLKKYNQAIEDYTRAVEIMPSYASAYNNRGLAYAHLRDYVQAIEDYTKALELTPDEATTYNNRGSAHYNLKAYAEAIQDYDKAITLDPTYAAAYLNRGITYARMQEYERAIEDYTEAIKLDPEYATAYNYRGLAHMRLQQYMRALEDYGQALAYDAEYATVYNNRGLVHVKLGDYDQALEEYQRAVEIMPEYATPYYNAACAAALKGDAEIACNWLKQAIEHKPRYRVMAQQDSDFDALRENADFRALVK